MKKTIKGELKRVERKTSKPQDPKTTDEIKQITMKTHYETEILIPFQNAILEFTKKTLYDLRKGFRENK